MNLREVFIATANRRGSYYSPWTYRGITYATDSRLLLATTLQECSTHGRWFGFPIKQASISRKLRDKCSNVEVDIPDRSILGTICECLGCSCKHTAPPKKPMHLMHDGDRRLHATQVGHHLIDDWHLYLISYLPEVQLFLGLDEYSNLKIKFEGGIGVLYPIQLRDKRSGRFPTEETPHLKPTQTETNKVRRAKVSDLKQPQRRLNLA